MTATSPTPCAFGALRYYPPTSSLVLFNPSSFPAYATNTVNTWQFKSGNWSLTNFGVGSNVSARSETSMAYDGTNLVLFGGKGPPGTEYMNDTNSYNGTTWTNVIPNYNSNGLVIGSTAGLTIRAKHYMAAMTGGITLFGGIDYNHTLQDTFTWTSGSGAWTQQFPANSPSIRIGAANASNGTNNFVLFGGANGSYALQDSWSWNGTNWSVISTNTPPSCRKNATMAWYPTGSCFIVFGGSDSGGNLLNDTWQFDGTSTWTQLFPTVSPSVREGAMMAYDTASSQLVLFGGRNNKFLLNDTFQWNGSTWVQL